MKKFSEEIDNRFNQTYIYGLIDPRDNSVRYIGKTCDIDYRLKRHIGEAIKTTNSTLKLNWIRKLLKENLKPTIETLDIVSSDEDNFWEMHYISLYKSWGIKLTNMTEGGDGWKKGYFTPEIRKRLSDKNTGAGNGFFGKKHSEKTCEFLSQIDRKGEKNSMFGKEHKKSSIYLMSEKAKLRTGSKNSRAKKLYQYDSNNVLMQVWNCAKDCADIYSISRGNISTYAKHNTEINSGFKMLKNFIFKFA